MKANDKLYVIPNGRVPNPATGKPLPAEGALVPNNAFWKRRLNDGEVKEGKPPRAPSAATATKTTSKKD